MPLSVSVHTEVPKPDTMSYEDVLVKYVMDAYKSRSKYGRPVIHYNDTLTVEFAIQLTQIVDLDEQEQVLTLNVWDQYVSTPALFLFFLSLFFRSFSFRCSSCPQASSFTSRTDEFGCLQHVPFRSPTASSSFFFFFFFFFIFIFQALLFGTNAVLVLLCVLSRISDHIQGFVGLSHIVWVIWLLG